MPVMAPNGDNKRDNPRLPSVRCSLSFIPGMAATHVPNNKLEVANKKPTDNTDLFLVKDIKLLNIDFFKSLLWKESKKTEIYFYKTN